MITSTIEIADNLSMLDLNVQLNIDHEQAGGPGCLPIRAEGTRIELFTDVGGNGSNFTNTLLDDDAATLITSGSASFASAFRPEGDLSLLAGEQLTGVWTLEIRDDRKNFTGSLMNWSLIVEHI